MQAIVTVLAVLFGLLFGSFANVPIYRWPLNRSVSEPKRSACPACDAPIRPRDNIPVVSWLLLGRRCHIIIWYGFPDRKAGRWRCLITSQLESRANLDKSEVIGCGTS